MYEIWMEIAGENIGVKEIPAEVLGKFLVRTQHLFHNVAQTVLRKPRAKIKQDEYKRNLQLVFTEFKGGSAVCKLRTSAQMTLEGRPYMEPVVTKFFETINAVKFEKEEDGVQKIVDTYPDRDQRIRILGNLKTLWPTKEVRVDYKAKYQQELIYKERLDISFQPRIPRWLNAELKQISQRLVGVITRLRIDGPSPYFYIQEVGSTGVRCSLDDELEEKVITNVKKPVYIEGIFEKHKKQRVAVSIQDLDILETTNMLPSEFPFLSKPVELDLDFDGDFYVATLPELELTLYSETYQGLKEEFEIEMGYLMDHILTTSDEKLSERMKHVKQALPDYINEE
ncbi:hypothetical protein CEE45_01530 [Candidatus Heimdallarchaeota archaeon B3_Heim]|nr:MAG: hypothetical protein CEE45_01530 [Candidatus Heimdallarchaeota archaeon B3_Heim]